MTLEEGLERNGYWQAMVLELLGHTRHCACRVAFGDGHCECGCPRFLRNWWQAEWAIRREGARRV